MFYLHYCIESFQHLWGLISRNPILQVRKLRLELISSLVSQLVNSKAEILTQVCLTPRPELSRFVLLHLVSLWPGVAHLSDLIRPIVRLPLSELQVMRTEKRQDTCDLSLTRTQEGSSV